MNFKQLQSFVEVVRKNSFTKAADELFFSQPTVSTHIQQLEAELGVKLVSRVTKGIELTAIGEETYEYAVNILNLKDRMEANCESVSRRSIHIGASTIPMQYILPEILPEFVAQHPDANFVIHEGDSQGVVDKLRDGLFDVGLVGMQVEDDALLFRPFCRDHMVFITPNIEKFQALQGRPDAIEELLKQPMIVREKGSGSKKMADHFLEKMGIQEGAIRVIARINDQETIKRMVAGGMGISMISERSARNYLETGKLLKFEFEAFPADRFLYVVFRKDLIQRGPTKSFIKLLEKKYW